MPLRDSVLTTRCSGVLLHPSSLPGRGIGEIGASARHFVDWLEGAGQALWQVLPLVPVAGSGSPYSGLSAMAGNPLLIDLDALAADGLLDPRELDLPDPDGTAVDYQLVIGWKEGLLRRAHAAFRAGAAPHLRNALADFRQRHAAWLDDYALFRALRDDSGGHSWLEWEPPLRDREPEALRSRAASLAAECERFVFQQFLFDRQWTALRQYVHRRGIRIIGDIPIFVALDSADVWANRQLFHLDASGQPEVVAGVPPDYFSATGQRWGNPLYRWDVMQARDYRWWTQRIRRAFDLVDVLRIDHFRGFEAYWEIPADAATATRGEWRRGPGAEFFAAIERELGSLPLIAEDLGLITPEVDELRDGLGLPGMRVLQFAFDGDPANPHLPENHPRNVAVYTGTHDNDTTLGWWAAAGDDERREVEARVDDAADVGWQLIRMAFGSRAHLAIVPLQDVLGLGSGARMNTPGVAGGNWSWRYREASLSADLQRQLHEITRETDRLHSFSRNSLHTAADGDRIDD